MKYLKSALMWFMQIMLGFVCLSPIYLTVALLGKGGALVISRRDISLYETRLACESGAFFDPNCFMYGLYSLFLILVLLVVMMFTLAGAYFILSGFADLGHMVITSWQSKINKYKRKRET